MISSSSASNFKNKEIEFDETDRVQVGKVCTPLYLLNTFSSWLEEGVDMRSLELK